MLSPICYAIQRQITRQLIYTQHTHPSLALDILYRLRILCVSMLFFFMQTLFVVFFHTSMFLHTYTHTKTHIKQGIIHTFLAFSMCTLCWTFFPLSTNRVFYRTFNIYTNTQYTHKLTKRNLNTKDLKSREQPPKTYAISKLTPNCYTKNASTTKIKWNAYSHTTKAITKNKILQNKSNVIIQSNTEYTKEKWLFFQSIEEKISR